MSDHAPELGVAVWIALRRAHQGGLTNLANRWLDSGRPVPGYVADALDSLTGDGLLVMADDLEAGGLRRVMVTDAGSARYLALGQVHGPRGAVAVSTPYRWALSPHDRRCHLLAEREPASVEILVAVCGHRMPWSVHTSGQPTEHRCLTCEALAEMAAPPRGVTTS